MKKTLPGIKEFRTLVSQKLLAAQKQGKLFIDLNAGDLHREAGGGTGNDVRVATCVSAMKQAINEEKGDKVLSEPPAGAGSSVTIHYKLPR